MEAPKWLSWPVSRVLYPARKQGGNHLSSPAVTRRLLRPTWGTESEQPSTQRSAPVWPCSRWGLPGRAGCPVRRWSLTPPFHPYRPDQDGGSFSVALSVGLPRLGITQHRALWSSDFPQAEHTARDCPANSTFSIIPECLNNWTQRSACPTMQKL